MPSHQGLIGERCGRDANRTWQATPAQIPFRIRRATLDASLGQVLLVILLGPIERRGRYDLGHDRPAVPIERREVLHRFLGLGLLLVVVIEDHRAVLSADVRSLAVELGRVVSVQKTSSSRSYETMAGS